MISFRIRLALAACLLAFSPALAIDLVAYHDRSGAEHQAYYDQLKPQGYRLISLTMYDDSANPLYAAVWVRRTGPAWTAFHGFSSSAYEGALASWASVGYRPVIVTINGTGATALYSAVLEKSSVGGLCKHGLVEGKADNPATIGYWNDYAAKNNLILRWATAYNTVSNPAYACIWEQNVDKAAWAAAWDESASTYQVRFNAQMAQWARPSFITLAPSQRYLSVFRDDQVGPWYAFHDMSRDQYQAVFNDRTANGYYPEVVQAAGSGDAVRFAAIFVTRESLTARQWSATGATVSSLSAFDSVMQNYMQQTNTRGGELAVVKDGRLVFARGYTWAEPGYPQTQPTSLFRIASSSKPLTSIVVHQYIEVGAINENTTLQSLLSLRRPDGGAPVDSRFGQVRVQHVLGHFGGWDTGVAGFDPAFSDADVVAAFPGAPLPVTTSQIASYMAGKPLQYTPGTKFAYSNFGFLQLGLCLEGMSGKGYEPLVKGQIFGRLGVTRPRMGRSLQSLRAAGEVRYHDSGLGVSASVLSSSRPWVPTVYGGWNQENLSAEGGWILAAPDYAKVLAAFHRGAANPLLWQSTVDQMWSPVDGQEVMNPTVRRGWFSAMSGGKWVRWHNGRVPGTASLVFTRSDNVAFVVLLNKDSWLRPTGHPLGDGLNAAADAVMSWPSGDQFPTYGIPSF